MKNPRIFLSLVEIAGYYSQLSKGFEQLGIDARTGFITEHKFDYDVHPPTGLQRCIQHLTTCLRRRSKLVKLLAYAPLGILMPCYFVSCLLRYDVFVFGFRRSFLPKHLDLPILKLLGKQIIFVFHGSDTRPAYLNGVFGDWPLSRIHEMVQQQYKAIKYIERYADHIVTQPAITPFHDRSLINWMALGQPCDLSSDVEIEVKDGALPIILHAPSNIKAKGTHLIRKAIEELKQEGCQFEYREMTNCSHQDVIDAIKGCHFIIDQVYSDLHIAGFGTEAAYYAKPSIVGGYALPKLAEFLKENTAPCYMITPDVAAVKNAVITLLGDQALCEKIGKDAQAFVQERWLAQHVARKYLSLILGDIDSSWHFSPNEAYYPHGCCIDNTERVKSIKDYIAEYGESALCLDHNPGFKHTLMKSLQ